ncbi:immune inhibitor A domain-containing protein [Turicibacter bilis]|uniref:immune inhibitor A domain-containing protein n=1 Tax=Turicibacter bilis TaxID=2735723 RepID=UPI0031BADB96
MLKKEGKIPQDATARETHEAYEAYIQEISKQNNVTLSKEERDLQAKKNKTRSTSAYSRNSNEVTELNVLAIMVEYSDYKHGQIQPDETSLYYDDYSKEHYQDMLFGDNGYTGPNGENFVSMKQYYEEQSGGSLIINGTVTDWYTAPQTAAYYGASGGGSNDARPRQLVADALKELAKDPNINLADFDQLDRYDLDGDGNYNEPDGMIDYLLVIHAGVGEEAGGGSLGSDAIWSHRWTLGGLYPIPGTEYTDEFGNVRNYYAYDYIINPEDGAAGVFCHEFGHDLGLPDEYDTQYSSGTSEPISRWSLMSSGSWSGTIPGTEPTGISPYSRQILQETYGGNFQHQTIINYDELSTKGTSITLNSANQTGEVIRVNLPDLEIPITTPTSGEYAYWSGKGVDGTNLYHTLTTSLDLSSATTPSLSFKTWYDIEEGWDFAYIQVKESDSDIWNIIPGNLTTSEHDPQAQVVVPYGITGTSDGWVDARFDLSGYAGKKVDIQIVYATDNYTFGQGIYVDDIIVSDNDTVLFSNDSESTDSVLLEGFTQDKGVQYATNYYLIEWRTHTGVDTGLAHNSVLGTNFSYDEGMVVWYVNEFYTENWGAYHPGGGLLSVIDADQSNIQWIWDDQTTAYASNVYQMHDAAFNSKGGSRFLVDATEYYGRKAIDKYSPATPHFKDKTDYSNNELPTVGTKLPQLGITAQITASKGDSATIKISKK